MPVKALRVEHVQFYLCHVQPAPVFGREHKFKPVPQPFGLFRFESFIKGGSCVRAEVVHHKCYPVCFRILLVRQFLDELRPVFFCFVLRHFYRTFAFQRFVRHEHIDHPVPYVLIINPGFLPRSHRNGKLARRDQLFRRLVHADHRVIYIIGPFVNIQHPLHVRDELAVAFRRYHPALYFPRLKLVFFKTSPTETWEMLGTYPSSTILSANNLKDHFAKPGGGSLQHNWTSFASTSPSIFLS